MLSVVDEPIALVGDASDFAGCTFRNLAARLSPVREDWIAIGLRGADGMPLGLALGELADRTDGEGLEAFLVSLMVLPQARGRHLGVALLDAFAAEARRRGATRLRSRHADNLPARAAFEATLRRAGWSDGESCRLRIYWRAGYAAMGMARWRSLSDRLFQSDLYQLDHWRPLSAADEASVARLKAQVTCRQHDFFFDESAPKADPDLSLLLRRGGELVGWVIGIRTARPMLDRTAIYYASAYLDEAIWHSSLMIAAYAEATRRQAEAHGPDSIGYFDTSLPRNKALVRRRLAPLGFRVDEFFETIKPLEAA